jgi:hypothetical protein
LSTADWSIVDCRLSIVDCRLSIVDWVIVADVATPVCNHHIVSQPSTAIGRSRILALQPGNHQINDPQSPNQQSAITKSPNPHSPIRNHQIRSQQSTIGIS